jgi:superkiller protein 3
LAFTSRLPRFRPTAQVYNALGLAHRRMANYDGAAVAFRRAVALDPRYALAYNNLGVIYEQRSQIPQAIAQYKKAVGLDPNLTVAKTNLARFRTQAGQTSGAAAPAASPRRRGRPQGG